MAKAAAIEADAELVERAQSGDAGAFAELAARYRPALIALAFDRTRNLDDAEDLAQEALVRALQHLSQIQDPSAFPSWLRAIAGNLCATWARCPQAQALTEVEADCADVVAAAIARFEQREIARALAALPTANRLALLMHVWHDMPYERIAAFLGVPVTTVEGRIFRARESLRRSLLQRATSLGLRRSKEKKNG